VDLARLKRGRDTTKSSWLTLTSECGIVAPQKYQIPISNVVAEVEMDGRGVGSPDPNENIPLNGTNGTCSPEKAKNENNVKHIKVKQRFPNPKKPTHSYANGRQIN